MTSASGAHTPTPWRLSQNVSTHVLGSHGTVILGCDAQNPREQIEAEANAAFIIKACNAHDELVATVIQYAMECPECNGRGRFSPDETGEHMGNDCEACAPIRAVLAKAGAPLPYDPEGYDTPQVTP